jgi:hypothetical protein
MRTAVATEPRGGPMRSGVSRVRRLRHVPRLAGGDLTPERVARRKREIAELNATRVRFADARPR